MPADTPQDQARPIPPIPGPGPKPAEAAFAPRPDEVCGNCRFADFRGDDAKTMPFCRRHPAPPIRRSAEDVASKLHVFAMWPIVSSIDWCGEHEPVTPAPAADPGWVAFRPQTVADLRASMAPLLALANQVKNEDLSSILLLDVADGVTLTVGDLQALAEAFEPFAGQP